jgi:hypothetical protein
MRKASRLNMTCWSDGHPTGCRCPNCGAGHTGNNESRVLNDYSIQMQGIAMNTIVANVLMREAAKARTNAHPFEIVALFCGVGLLASLCAVALGFDIGSGFF